MPLNKLVFKDAWEVRDQIDKAQQARIRSLYTNWANQIKQKAKKYELIKKTASAPLSALQYRELSDLLSDQSHDIAEQLVMGLKQDIYTIADSVVKSNNDWLVSLGLSGPGVESAFSSIPTTVVQNLVTGNIYKDGYNLSERIWGDNEDTLAKLYEIVGGGRAMNLSTYEITKQLEQFVRPGAAKQWNLRTKDGKRIYPKQVDYNAQRLARTLSQHAYQQSFIATIAKNPMIPKVIWWANGSRVCKICLSLHGQKFDKDKVPLDHPNGMCVLIPDVNDNIEQQIADWVNAPDGTFQGMDEFAKSIGYKPLKQPTLEAFIDKWGTSTKSPSSWFNSLSPVQKAEASKLKESSGLTWNKWYEKNIYAGDGSNLVAKKKAVAAIENKVDQTIQAKVAEQFNRQEWIDSLDKNDLRKMEKWCAQWVKQISEDELDAIQVYTGNAFEEMNKYLRGIIDYNKYEEEINLAKSALSKASLPEDVIVRRGTNKKGFKALFSSNDPNEDARTLFAEENKVKYIGSVVKDNGFLSTSPDISGGFHDDINYIIKVPKGSNAMYVDPISRMQGENELLINQGKSYIVEDLVKDDYAGTLTVFMRLIK
jgi:hypothetical protein